jgi:hypothetical protein
LRIPACFRIGWAAFEDRLGDRFADRFTHPLPDSGGSAPWRTA